MIIAKTNRNRASNFTHTQGHTDTHTNTYIYRQTDTYTHTWWWWGFVERGYVHAATACSLCFKIRIKQSLMHSFSKPFFFLLRTGKSSVCFFFAVSFELCSLRETNTLFHTLGAALENALTLKWFLLFLQHWGCGDETGWRTADDALEGSGLTVSEGTVELCHSYYCTRETGFCS